MLKLSPLPPMDDSDSISSRPKRSLSVSLDTLSHSTGSDLHRGVRRYHRILFSAPIELYHLVGDGVERSHGISVDISEEGMGALLEKSLRVGEMVEVKLPVQDHLLNAIAVVRHSSSSRAGMEFLGLTLEERSRINAMDLNSAFLWRHASA
jgi:hypothetical protein